jgi:RecA/RadA recombinase
MTKEKDEQVPEETQEQPEETQEQPQIEQVDLKEVMDSVKVDGEVAPEIPSVPPAPPEVTAPPPSTPTPGEPAVGSIEEEAVMLYKEFNTFLEQKVEIKEDTGRKQVIPTGIDLLDAILGGGFAVGSLNIVVGQPGSGKSMLAMQAQGNAQRIYRGKLLASYLDSEEATTTIRLANLGVRNPMIKPYVDITVEKVFRFIEGLCIFKHEKKIVNVPSFIVWDSIANTLSIKEREAEDPNSVIGYKARLLSILIPKYVSKIGTYNICLVAVNQLRDVIQMGQFTTPRDLRFMSSHKDMPGGNVLKFNAFQLLEMKVKGILKPEMYDFEGIKVGVKCVKNKLFPPNVEILLIGDFVRGFSNFWTNFDFLKETNRLKAGAWNYLISLPDKKFRTKDAPQLYKENNDFKNAFDVAVKDAIQKDIVEAFNPKVF